MPDPADHDWTIDEAADYGSTGHERFRHPDDDVGVSVWAYDPGPDVSLETTADIVAWAEDFCRLTDSQPRATGSPNVRCRCAARAGTATQRCSSRSANDAYAFIPGYAGDGRMLIAAVWRPEEHESTRPYGRVEAAVAFLSTINGGGNAGVVPAPSAMPSP